MRTEERVLAALQDMLGDKVFLSGKHLARRVAEQVGIDPLDAKLALGSLARQGAVTGITGHGESMGRITLTVAPPARQIPISLTRWKAAMVEAGVCDEDAQALAPCHNRLAGFSDSDMVALVRGLLRLRAGQEGLRGTPQFVASAKHLLGSSKLLGYLPPSSLRVFGLDISAFTDAIPYVVVAGPEEPEAVLLIENPTSFNEVFESGCWERIALMATYGYGLSRTGEAFGESLSEAILQEHQLVPLSRAGQPPKPANLLRHERLFFWGDLDREGLRIYAGLRKKLPGLRASALYWPIAQALQDGQSHPYVKATGKENQGFPASVPMDVVGLLTLCTERAVDQEILDRETIARLASLSLEEYMASYESCAQFAPIHG